MTEAPSRFAFIHSLRGVAALLVVWAHLSGMWLWANGTSSTIQAIWHHWFAAPFAVYQNGGHLGVMLFFLVSGYIITHTSLRETHVAFVTKRVLRILPPLLLAIAIAWLMLRVAEATGTSLLGVNDASGVRWVLSTVLLDGFMPGGIRVLDVTWTLIVEVIFYSVTLALLSLSKSNPLKATWMMIGTWMAFVVVSINVFPINASPNRATAAALGFLILGRCIYLWHQRVIQSGDAAVLAGLVFVVYLLSVEASEPGGLLTAPAEIGIPRLLTYLTAPLIFVALMRAAPKRTLLPVRFLGDISYSLYLLHIPVGITVMNLLHLAAWQASASTLVAIAASLVVAWLSYRFVELPSQRLARRLLRSRSSRGEQVVPASADKAIALRADGGLIVAPPAVVRGLGEIAPASPVIPDHLLADSEARQ